MPQRIKPFPQEVQSMSGPLAGAGVNVTTGLNEGKIFPMAKDRVIEYLSKLNYGVHWPEFWDCEDRAFYGVAHARRMFPGIPIGVAEGIALEGPAEGQDHAVIILWYKNGKDTLDHTFFEPLLKNNKKFGEVKFPKTYPSPPVRITAFPSDTKRPDIKDTIPPLNKYTRLKDRSVAFDNKRLLYRTRTDDGLGILDYLENKIYEKECPDIANHTVANQAALDLFWKDADKALWSCVHVRRAYPGMPIGVAIGKPVEGDATAVNILWYREGDKENGAIKMLYWDPQEGDKGAIVKFEPRVTFM